MSRILTYTAREPGFEPRPAGWRQTARGGKMERTRHDGDRRVQFTPWENSGKDRIAERVRLAGVAAADAGLYSPRG